MFVYNLSMHVEHGIHADWLQWQRQEQIPAVMDTRQFTEYRFFHLLDQDETEGITYVLQYFSPSEDHYKRFRTEFASLLEKEAADKWGNRLIVFPTVMEVMH